jgi:hypothetical protein
MVIPMDQISIKKSNPKCRLYWCLIEFLDWRLETGDTVSHVGIFDPYCEPCDPRTFSLVHLLPSPPLPCVNKYSGMYCIHIVCNGGGGIGGLRQLNTCSLVPLLVNF